jgi:hypothetical protein
MKLLKRALRLNNEGVQHLLNQRDNEADDCFTQSLSWLKYALSCDEMDGYEDQSLLVADDDDYDDESDEPIFCTTSSIHQATHSIPDLQDPICFIYSNALVFALEDPILQCCSDNFHVCSAVVLLNIAMAYHRRAILSGNSEWRVKAEKMYEMIIKLSDCNNTEEHHDTALLTKIASINNLSQLCHSEGDYESSRDGFEYLGEVLLDAEAQLCSLLCHEEIVTGMILNIMLAKSQVIAPAA